MNRLKVFIGWDAKDADAFKVCEHSLRKRASIPVEVIALKDWELRRQGIFWRSHRVDDQGQMWDDRDGKPFSTSFSFTRFAVPILSAEEDIVLFCDPDMLWRGDVADLVTVMGERLEKAVLCVQHDHKPPEQMKMTGALQTHYLRKNWSSLMVLRPWRCQGLTKFKLNNDSGAALHALTWVPEEEIGALPEEWNWLEGHSSPEIDPKVVHFTRGTPDMPGYESTAFADEWRQALFDYEHRFAGAHQSAS